MFVVSSSIVIDLRHLPCCSLSPRSLGLSGCKKKYILRQTYFLYLTLYQEIKLYIFNTIQSYTQLNLIFLKSICVQTQYIPKVGFYLRRYLRLLNPAASDLPLGRRCFADLNSQAPALLKFQLLKHVVYILIHNNVE